MSNQNQEATILLVDGDIHGQYSIDTFIDRYWSDYVKFEDEGKRPLVPTGLDLDDHNYWDDRHNETFREFASGIDDYICRGEVSVCNVGDSTLWRVEWCNGDLIGVNPLAEWCDKSECYKLETTQED